MNYYPSQNEVSDEFYANITEFNKGPTSHEVRYKHSTKSFLIDEFIGEPSKTQAMAEDLDKIEVIYRKERIYSDQPPSA